MKTKKRARARTAAAVHACVPLLLVVAVALLTLSIAGCAAALKETSPRAAVEETMVASVPAVLSRQETRDLTAAEKAVLNEGFVSGIDNPEAAKFRWARIPTLPTNATASFEYCGMINVKNGNGAYDGWQPFLATIKIAAGSIAGGALVALNTGNKPENRDVIPKLCHQKGLDPEAAK